jgi:hypothetical protein
MSHRNIKPLVDENNHVVQLSVDLVVTDENGVETIGRFHRIIPESDRKSITEWSQVDVDVVCEFLDSEFGESLISQSQNKNPVESNFGFVLENT